MTWSQLASTAFLLASSRHGGTLSRYRSSHEVDTPPSLLCTSATTRLFATPSPSTAPLPQTTEDDKRYQALLSWFEASHPSSHVSPKFVVSKSPCGGYGAFAASDVSEGELLLAIPRSTCVTMDDLTNDVDCGEKFRELIDKAGPGGLTVALAGYLAKERLLMREGTDVKLAPYLRTLPWERGINGQEHVLFWSDEDTENLLRGSLAYEDAMDIRSEVKYAIKALRLIIGPAIGKARGDDETDDRPPWAKWMQRPPSTATIDGFDEAVTGAFVCVLTRSFNVEMPNGEEEEMLEPLLDMLQHSDDPSVTHRYVDGIVEVRACRDIAGGEELFNQYRTEKDLKMPYHKFFTRFGFVPGILEPVTELLRDRSTIFYPQRARDEV